MMFANEKHARMYAQLTGLHYMSAEDIANGVPTIAGVDYKTVDYAQLADHYKPMQIPTSAM